MKKLIQNIRDWATAKGIDTPECIPSQTHKVIEEIGELSQSILKQDDDGIADAIGDIAVTLIILCQQHGINVRYLPAAHEPTGESIQYHQAQIVNIIVRGHVEELHTAFEHLTAISQTLGYDLPICLAEVWEVIKDRQGKTVNGTFIKDDEKEE